MTQTVDYKQLAHVLLATCEALYASMQHANIEVDDITFRLSDKNGNEHDSTSTVEVLLMSCRYALGLQNAKIVATEQKQGDA